MKSLASILLAACMTVAVFAGCSKGGGDQPDSSGAQTPSASDSSAATPGSVSVNPRGVYPIVPAELPPVELSVIVCADVPFEDDNYAIRHMEEKGNLKLSINTFPKSEAGTKLNLMLTSGDYPDIFQSERNVGDPITFTTDRLERYGVMEGILLPLNSYIEEYGVEINRLFELRPEYRLKVSGSDGQVYGFPNAWECHHCTAYPKAWINVEYMEELGLSMPQTTDELEQVLLAFVSQDPNGNGRQDEIGLTGTPVNTHYSVLWWMLNSFLPVSAVTNAPNKSNFTYGLEDGSIVFSATQPEFKEGLAYMNRLYEQGLIDPAAFTQNDDQFKALLRQDTPVAGIFIAPHIAAGIDNTKREQATRYEVLAPVEGPGGARYQGHIDYVDITGHSGMVITNKCKNPEAAFRYGDMQYEEEMGMIKQSGLQGVGWDYAEPGTKTVSGKDAKFWWTTVVPTDRQDEWKKSLFAYGPVNRTADLWDACNPLPEDIYDPRALEARLSAATNLVDQYFYPYYVPSSLYMGDEAETFLDIQTNIVDTVNTYTVQFVTGSQNLDRDWDSYVKHIEGLGLSTYMDILQRKYTEYLALVD